MSQRAAAEFPAEPSARSTVFPHRDPALFGHALGRLDHNHTARAPAVDEEGKYSDDQTVEMGRMAVHNRIFPLMEVEDGTRWRFTMDSAGDPVGPYIRAQGRFRHLSDDDIARVQADVDARWDFLNRMVAGG